MKKEGGLDVYVAVNPCNQKMHAFSSCLGNTCIAHDPYSIHALTKNFRKFMHFLKLVNILFLDFLNCLKDSEQCMN